MIKSETAKLLTVISAAYPRFPELTPEMISIWHEMFQDIDYQVANVALRKLMLENTFPPSIAELRKTVVDIMTPKEDKIDAAQAWGEVIHAVRYFGYYREDEAIASVSPRTARVVQMIGWQNICITEEMDVLRGQFRMMYETTEHREKQDKLIPAQMAEMIEGITGKSKYITAGKDEAAVTRG